MHKNGLVIGVQRTLCLLFLGLLVSAAYAGPGLNDSFGIPIWKDSNLWDDSFLEAAARLGVNPSGESAMAMLSPESRILGARAYSIHLYGNGGKASQIVIAFANKADMVNELMASHKGQASYKPEDALLEASRKWNEEIKKSKDAIISKLQPQLGSPKISSSTSTWNWNNHLIELSEKESALSLSITPSAPTPSSSTSPGYTRVKTKPNGDVVLEKIPVIDQGPRGFCAPAAWEKCLRFYGLTLNVYELADIGGTGAGGTQWLKLASNMTPLLQNKGFRVDLLGAQVPTPESVSGYIDQGIPLIWGMDAKDLDLWIAFNKQRTANGLPLSGAPAIAKSKSSENLTTAHAITIIGYSRRSNEIAISDTRSSAPEFQEIWIPIAYTQSASLGDRMIAIVRESGSGTTSSSSGDRSVAPISTDSMGRKRF